MQFCLHTHILVTFFCFSRFVSLLFTHCTLVLIQSLSLSACNNVNLFSTAMEQGKTPLVSLLYWKVLMHWAHFTFIFYSLWLPSMSFCTFVHFWKKTLLKEEFYLVKRMKERRRGVFNLSCLIVWLTFYDGALCTCLFLAGKKSTLNMLQRNYIQSVIHCILCCYSWRLIIFKDLPCTEAEDDM